MLKNKCDGGFSASTQKKDLAQMGLMAKRLGKAIIPIYSQWFK